MKTVITGGAGFIGSNLVRRLLDNGREVAIADNFSRGSTRNLLDLGIRPQDVGDGSSFVNIDLRNYEQAKKITENAETVFHLAARIGSINFLHGSYTNELEALQNNLIIDVNVLRACLENGVKKLVFASSISVYPIDLQETSYKIVMSESDFNRYNPEGGYGWAKLLGEIELAWMEKIHIGIARIFNIYGENSHIAENPHVVVDLMRKAIYYPKEKFNVWGDGKQSRDFLYVSDCTDALVKLEGKADFPPVIVNIASGVTTNIGTLARKIVDISGKHIKLEYDRTKPVGPLSRTADISNAKSELDWQPQVSLDEGLRRTYAWLERRLSQ
jgi:GDP-D-mannose 3', 5'-epimerase